MDTVDVIVIGAGVVGLAIARELSRENSVVVFEQHRSFGQETSSRNSEVIHGGMYYPKDSLKARLCVEGRRLLYSLCDRHRIPYIKTGKLIVATVKEELNDLEKLLEQGRRNGVEDLALLSAKEASAIEPNIRTFAALYSPQTGIIDSHRLMEFFLEEAEANNALFAFNSKVTGIEKVANGYIVRYVSVDTTEEIFSKIVINCAGLESDDVASFPGLDIYNCSYGLHYCKGQYFRIAGGKASLVRGLVYPVPKPRAAGLGIHATVDLGGGLRLGPDEKYLETRTKDFTVDHGALDSFFESARTFLPFLQPEDLFPDTSGIRPKLQREGGTFRDFIISEESKKGFPGLINLVGIESPGLTASPAIAKAVKKMALNEILH